LFFEEKKISGKIKNKMKKNGENDLEAKNTKKINNNGKIKNLGELLLEEQPLLFLNKLTTK
jgi:hypothetical protein